MQYRQCRVASIAIKTTAMFIVVGLMLLLDIVGLLLTCCYKVACLLVIVYII